MWKNIHARWLVGKLRRKGQYYGENSASEIMRVTQERSHDWGDAKNKLERQARYKFQLREKRY